MKEDSVMQRPDLANTMNLISENGTKGFYEGEVAQKIVNRCLIMVETLQLMIFKNTKQDLLKPIGVFIEGVMVFTHGPPSGGGIVLLTALKVLEYFDLGKIGNNSALTYHLLAEALRRGTIIVRIMWAIHRFIMFLMMI